MKLFENNFFKLFIKGLEAFLGPHDWFFLCSFLLNKTTKKVLIFSSLAGIKISKRVYFLIKIKNIKRFYLLFSYWNFKMILLLKY